MGKIKKALKQKTGVAPDKQILKKDHEPLKKGDTVLRDSKPVGKYGLKEKDVLTGKPGSGITIRTQVGTARVDGGEAWRAGKCAVCSKPSTFLKRQAYHGADLAVLRNIASAQKCCQRCQQTKGCKFWTYGTHAPKKHYCWLKHASSGRQHQNNREAGHVCKTK